MRLSVATRSCPPLLSVSFVLSLPLLACAPLAIAAQATPVPAGAPAAPLPYGHAVPAPSVVAVHRNGAVAIDGKLDEAAWAAATPITDFTQIDPDEGKPASQRTEVRFLYDDDALYVGARMWDTAGAAGIKTRLVRRDANFDSDYFEIVIDGYHDHLSRAFFDLNPSGSKGDQIGIGTSCCDNSWDPIWEAATRIDSTGWTAEIRIPFSQLRFGRDSVQTWGLEVRRFIKRRDEQDQWAFWRKTESGGPSRFGHLEGLHIPTSTSHLELLPYVVTKSSTVATSPGDPFNRGARPTMSVGLDLKNRLTSNLTLDATINPDFGQVEVDPAVLNLSAFETFFPEKRPFFVEGAQVFNFGSYSCDFCVNFESMSGFYSRRIGRAPTGGDLATDNFAFADVPDATTILGASKITGRTASGYTIGLLDAVTGQANARVQSFQGVRGSQEVEPLANYLVSRVARDFMGGNMVVGGMFSGMARNIDTTFASRLARHAEMYGNDMVYTWDDHTYALRASAALTNVSGDAGEIALREQSSARYYQRPDRGGSGSGSGLFTNRYDTTATSLRGGGIYARLAKETGTWMWETAVNSRTPGYETNDYAFQQHADYTWYNANLLRYWSTPTSWYQTFTALVGGQGQNNYEGNRTALQFQEYASETTRQFWNVTEYVMERPGQLDDQQLRGGPLVRDPTNQYAEFDLSTDTRHRVIGSSSVQYTWDQAGGSSRGVSLSAEYRPRPNVAVSFGPSWNVSRIASQYVTAVSDSTAVAFYGTRYVMSRLDQRTLELDTRLSLTFSPTMTLELYLQPFFASGHYANFGEYAAPRSATVDVYGVDSRDDRVDHRLERRGERVHDRSGRHGRRAVVHARQSRLQPAVAAGERGVSVGVSPRVRLVCRVDAVALRGFRVWKSRLCAGSNGAHGDAAGRHFPRQGELVVA